MSSVAGGIDAIEAVFDDGSLVADAGLLLAGTVMSRLGLEALIDDTVRLGGSAGRGAFDGRWAVLGGVVVLVAPPHELVARRVEGLLRDAQPSQQQRAGVGAGMLREPVGGEHGEVLVEVGDPQHPGCFGAVEELGVGRRVEHPPPVRADVSGPRCEQPASGHGEQPVEVGAAPPRRSRAGWRAYRRDYRQRSS